MKRKLMFAALALLMAGGAAHAATPNAEQKTVINSFFTAAIVSDLCRVALNENKIKTDLFKVGLVPEDFDKGARFESYIAAANITAQQEFRDLADGIPKDILCDGFALRFGSETFKPDNRDWLKY
jgi:hypothetical protein